MKIYSRSTLYSAGIILTLGLIYGYASPDNKDNLLNNNLEDHIKITVKEDALPQQIRAVFLHKDFEFAGEQVPLKNEDVRERLEKELTVNSYYHSSTILNICLLYTS